MIFPHWSKMLLLWGGVIMGTSTSSLSCADCNGANGTCVDGVCLSRCVNVTLSGECLQCRDSRFYGKQCENDCPHTCLNSTCQLNESRVVCTEGCVTGKRGGNCKVDCPTSCEQCERYDDQCIGECISSLYYGDLCQTLCPPNCKDVCKRDSGACKTCKPGHRGIYCDELCPSSCKECKQYGDVSGECMTCKSGYRGIYCNVSCPIKCSECEQHGEACITCINNQYYGLKCEHPCNTNCKDCIKDTGQCTVCKEGYGRTPCDEQCLRCTEEDCQNVICSKEVFKDEAPSVGIVLVTLAVCICLIFVGVVILIRCKRAMSVRYKVVSAAITTREKRKTHKKNDNHAVEWEYENIIYECSTGIRSLPRVKPCTELKGELATHYMKQEFKDLPEPQVQSSHCGQLAENFLKNRYKDILPFDNTRVCLAVEDEDQSDYINASYIDGYRQRTQYIAAQAPTKAMLTDFWRMIWQGGVVKIVMLTNLVEEGNVKCKMYWPSCGIDYITYGDVSVQCVEEKVFEHHTVRALAVWKANCPTKRISQFHYTSWPAQGVPGEVTSLIDFYKVVKNTSTDEDGPTLVHCSAGVGRTGTFLSLVYLIEQARYEGRACVYTCVHDIRFQRMKMVNTEEQYIFLYRVLIGALQTRGILPDNSVPVWLQCRLCWETDRQHPVINGVFVVLNQSNSTASLPGALV